MISLYVSNYYFAFKVSLQAHTKYMTLNCFDWNTMHDSLKIIELDLFQFESVRAIDLYLLVFACTKVIFLNRELPNSRQVRTKRTHE